MLAQFSSCPGLKNHIQTTIRVALDLEQDLEFVWRVSSGGLLCMRCHTEAEGLSDIRGDKLRVGVAQDACEGSGVRVLRLGSAAHIRLRSPADRGTQKQTQN